MRAGQTLVASDGYEVALFPLEYMNISQGEMMPSGWSHYNVYNIDFLGWGPSGRVHTCPIYAPCTMKVVAFWNTYEGGHTVIFESVNKVHLADGSIDYLTIYFAHAQTPPVTTIGAVVQQGQLCYYTGTYGNVIGTDPDHVHTCCGKGRYQGTTVRSGGHTDLTNRIHYYDAVYTNDTVIIDDDNYNWKTWTGPTPPIPTRKSKFPWVLYARKLREKNSAD